MIKGVVAIVGLSLIHISEPTRQAEISYAVFCLKKKKKKKKEQSRLPIKYVNLQHECQCIRRRENV